MIEMDMRRKFGIMELEDWLTPSEAGRVLDISKQAVVKRLDAGQLAGVKTHQGWLIPPDALEEARVVKRGRPRKSP